jgi:hypothetical protein
MLIDYVADRKDILEKAFDSVPPFPVQSIDHTFNVNKRTTTYVAPPPPERSTDTEQIRRRFLSKEENGFLVCMGANGVVSYAAFKCNCYHCDHNNYTSIIFFTAD